MEDDNNAHRSNVGNPKQPEATGMPQRFFLADMGQLGQRQPREPAGADLGAQGAPTLVRPGHTHSLPPGGHGSTDSMTLRQDSIKPNHTESGLPTNSKTWDMTQEP